MSPTITPFTSAATVKTYLLGLQERIVTALAAIDGQPFSTDAWQRPEGGGGISRIIEEGNVFERGGVGFSHVTGKNLPPSAAANRPTTPATARRRAPLPCR